MKLILSPNQYEAIPFMAIARSNVVLIAYEADFKVQKHRYLPAAYRGEKFPMADMLNVLNYEKDGDPKPALPVPKPTTYTMSDLTADEVKGVNVQRGMRMTGYTFFPNAQTGLGYYWSMGIQPNDATVKLIGDIDPIRAAEKFLKHYEPRPFEGYYSYAYNAPTPRPPAKERMVDVTFEGRHVGKIPKRMADVLDLSFGSSYRTMPR